MEEWRDINGLEICKRKLEDMKEIYSKLQKIQQQLKAPKGQYNEFNNFNYRSAEDILEAVKPLLLEQGLTLTLSDQMEYIGNRYYIKATATLTDGDDTITSTAYAREDESRAGMSESQVTGCSSSYARKYCLNGLFLIDDGKDSDSFNNKKQKATTQPTPMQKSNREILTEFCTSMKGKTDKSRLLAFFNYYNGDKADNWSGRFEPERLFEKFGLRSQPQGVHSHTN